MNSVMITLFIIGSLSFAAAFARTIESVIVYYGHVGFDKE